MGLHRPSRAAALPVLLCVAAVLQDSWATQYLSTIAGGGPDNIPALTTDLFGPNELAFDSTGALYFSARDHHRVYKVGPDGIIVLVAGTGCAGFSGDGGPAERASLNYPGGITVDAAGAVFIADTLNHRLRRVDGLTGIITTVAGTGVRGYAGDGGPAVSAALAVPMGVTTDASGNLLISDRNNFRVRKIDRFSGIISTVAGGGNGGDGSSATQARIDLPISVAVHPAGHLFIVAESERRVRRVDATTGIITTVAGGGTGGDGVPATSALLLFPHAVVLDTGGNLLISETPDVEGTGYHRIRRVDATTGIISTLAGMPWNGFAGDGGPANQSLLDSPRGLAVASNGSLFIADTGNRRIRRVDSATGVIQTAHGSGVFGYGGEGFPAVNAGFWGPLGLTVDSAGDLLVATTTHILRVNAVTGLMERIAGDGQWGFSGDGGPAIAARVNAAWGLITDAAGNIFFADSNNDRVRRIEAQTGIITTVAGNGEFGFSGDGGPATDARLYGPRGVILDSSGNLLIVDAVNGRIRRVSTTTGIITTIVGGGTGGDGSPALNIALGLPEQIVLDTAGNMFIVENADHRVRRVDVVSGLVTRVAGTGLAGFSGDGGPATSAMLRNPRGLTIDTDGHLYIADSGNNRVRRVDLQTGIIETVAGDGSPGCSGDGNIATSSSLSRPMQLAVDPDTRILFADVDVGRVRAITNGAVGAGRIPATTDNRSLDVMQGPDEAISLAWGRSCNPNDFDYEVYEGPLASFGGHEAVACSTGGSRAITFLPNLENAYYLVVPRNAASEGSYGLGSDGLERVQATPACLPQLMESVCQ